MPFPTIIRTDGTSSFTQPEDDKKFSLKEMQKVVGGHIEIVHLDKDMVMVLNEEGKLRNLPLNTKATALFRLSHPGNGDFVVGDVLVCTPKQAGFNSEDEE
jgi:hypothetical protein